MDITNVSTNFVVQTKNLKKVETFDTPSQRKKLVMWCKITELFSHGQTKSQISRNLGISRARVRRYLKMSYDEFTSSDAYRCVYDHKLDCYEQFILDELRSCPSHSSNPTMIIC